MGRGGERRIRHMSEDEAYLVYGTCLQPRASFCIDNNCLSYLSSLAPRSLPEFILQPWTMTARECPQNKAIREYIVHH